VSGAESTPPHSPLRALLSPTSIAVVGASADRTKIRGTLFHQIVAAGFAGLLYPITSSVPEIAGHRCYPTISAVGAPIDLAIVAIPTEVVMGVLEDCAAAGVRTALVLTSGFAEQGGQRVVLQDRMSRLARSSGMRICGPNSVGFFNAVDRVAATFSPAVGKGQARAATKLAGRHRVGVISQSGGMGFTFYDYGSPLGLGFSCLVNTGNEVDITASDVFLHMAQDPATDVILLFLEGLRDPVRFIEAADAAAAAGKPVVVCKVGRSQAATRAAQSHTANMTGWDAAYDAVFRRYGMTVASDPEEMTAIAAALATCPPALGRRVGIVTVSGGTGALMSDALAAKGFTVPELSEALQREIGALIPSFGSAANPVDATASGAFDGGLENTVDRLAASDEVDAIILVTSLANETRVGLGEEGLRRIVQRQTKPVLCYSYTRPSALACATLAEAGMVVNMHLTWTVRALRALAERGCFRYRPQSPPSGAALSPSEAAPVETAAAKTGAGGALCEYEARALLEQGGVVRGSGVLVRERSGLQAAGEAAGWPVAMKIQSPDILHKTEVGGVALNLGDPAALEETYDRILAAATRVAPNARIHGVLLQTMAPKGLEMIVSAINDPTFGPIMMVGAGGVNAELYRDVAYRLAPLDEADAADMLAELRSAPLLRGWRGAPAADIPALTGLIARLSRFALQRRGEMTEIELNPVLVHTAGEGCTVVDALLVLGAPA